MNIDHKYLIAADMYQYTQAILSRTDVIPDSF